ncbi:Aldose 1-epimerase [Streptomyces sp. RB5]|uniref:Aldose 1-epimerase n=1 Tax=Streptomyces smaragdinus TaxID=2585196 RepID=A0A7K0CD30_9ACTN|nr:aldose epimerase family protein [Streptomyces smaragdinus]MQY11361.1 Aldose 1-epimerase [Streptomyces smaragdinus]
MISSAPFGALDDGTSIERWTLEAGGTRVDVLTYGGVVHRVHTPDRDGREANIALGWADLAGYLANPGPYFGAVIGRYANRIAGASFTLDGRTYKVPANDGTNCLHGGDGGFDKRVWAAEPAGEAAVTLRRTSPDGEEGFPGTLDVAVTYTVGDDGALRIDYTATTDAPTVVSLTNHSYFNLDGEGTGSAEQHTLRVAADRYTPNLPTGSPTGELAPVADTPFDFREAKPLARDLRSGHPQLLTGHGYDHNLVLDKGVTETPVAVAELRSPASGRTLTVSTTSPGLQLYTGNSFDGALRGTSGRTYRPTDGVALETQHFADSPNQPRFPSTVLRPGEVHRATTVYGFGIR